MSFEIVDRHDLTWTCHVCGEERPDKKISIRTRDISAEYNLPPGTVTENIRYCNDRRSCAEPAQTMRLKDMRGF